MDLDALKIAALVATHGSFARVARLKNVDPSSISRSVAGIEEQLGLRLFQRSTRRLTPTEEGARYLERIGPLLDEMELAHEEAAAFRQNPTGTLRLTASIAFGSECIVPLLHKLQAQLPNLIVELQLSDSNLDLVENGIDLAIRLTPAPEGELISTRLRTTRYYICVSPDFLKTSPPLATPEDLKEANCLRYALPRLPHVWRFRGKDGNLREISVDGKLLISSPLAVREAARHGLGPALLADWLVDGDLKSGSLVRLFEDHEVTATEFDTAAYALYPSRAYLPAKTRAVLDFLKAHL